MSARNHYTTLTSKSSTVVNHHLKKYVLWGIEHIRVGPTSSQLNLCERTHQSLVEMTKATMLQARFHVSLWSEALCNAAYVKNRVCNKETQGIPYKRMFGIKPDVHHIRKFGTLAYVHVPVTLGRRKHHNNANLGYVLGYAEDIADGKVYLPDERTAKFVTDLRVVGDVVYRDRHDIELDGAYLSSLHFTKPVAEDATSQTAMVDTNSILPSGVEEGENEVDESEIMSTIDQNSQFDLDEVDDNVEGPAADVEDDTEVDLSADIETVVYADSEPVEGDDSKSNEIAASDVAEQDVVSDAGTRGSSVADGDLDDDDEHSGDEGLTVTSIFASKEDDDKNSSNVLNLDEYIGNEKEYRNSNTQSVQHESNHEVIDASSLMGNQPKKTGKRSHRDEPQSKEERVGHEAAKAEPKKTRRGL
ncbi:unnamed protein product [Phytophthora fragariaefolia]|uniref:Unnamed protein product n=1 Tax=Phytophthora fragariaefolia TaxID=1490495 RepID=A0A9W6Y1B9_9STRA|nr:unnamed protein product [Phytophthora fragariaefolia]